MMSKSFIGHVYEEGLVTDSINTTLSIAVQEMRCSVKCTISVRAENDGPGGSRERRLGGRVYLPRVSDLA